MKKNETKGFQDQHLSIAPWPSFMRKYSRLSEVTAFQSASADEGSPFYRIIINKIFNNIAIFICVTVIRIIDIFTSLTKFAQVEVNSFDIRLSGSSRLPVK